MNKKFRSTLLCLAMTLGLLAGFNGTASATNYRVVDWDISRITDGGDEHAARYWKAIDGIHQNSYGNATGQTGITQTTTDTTRMVQIRVRDTGGNELVSLYFWADNLYLAGWYAPYGGDPNNTNPATRRRHFQFNENRSMADSLGVGVMYLGRTGNYNALPGGNDRGHLVITPATIYNAAYVLGHATGYNDNVGSAALIMIQAFSEAARFGPILDRVYNNIYHHNATPLGDEYAGLENQWDALAAFANNVHRNGSSEMDVLGHRIRNFQDLRQRLTFVERQGKNARL
ncbi:hypothetical protein IPZ70_15840 [Streptomyces polychromogenes]|nr:hypothetical protein [Streptomyces polychromogenes]